MLGGYIDTEINKIDKRKILIVTFVTKFGGSDGHCCVFDQVL